MDGTFPEWLNANSGRAFPLAENSLRTGANGLVKIPDSLIVAAQICMTPSYAGGQFYIHSLSVSPSTIVIEVGYQPVSGPVRNIAVVPVPVTSHAENTTYAFSGAGQDSSLLGSLTIGTLADTLENVPGIVLFEPESTPLEVSCLMVSSPALEAVEIYERGALFGRFTKILKLRAGENIRLSYVDGDTNTIRIDAIANENLVNPGDCANVTPLPPPIRTINGQPGIEGNFNVDGGKCIAADASPGLLTLSDLCSQSCCGCNELSTLMAALKQVEAQRDQLNLLIQSSMAQQSAMLISLAAAQQ